MIRVSVKRTEARGGGLKGVARELPGALKRAVQLATLLVWSDARSRTNWNEAGHGAGPQLITKGKNKGLPKKLSVRKLAALGHPAPPPGPLRIITGMLLRSIGQRTEAITRGTKGVVGSALVYARIHELGGGNTGARPYLGPALERRRADVLARISGAVRSATTPGVAWDQQPVGK